MFKVKILLVPLIISISAALCIWLVYPAYSNGQDGVKEKSNQLEKEKIKLAEMKEKNINVEKLFSEMVALSLEKSVLYKFIPENIKEDEIVDSINRFASETGLTVLEVSLKPSQSATKNSAAADDLEKETSLPSSREYKATIGLKGSYEKIKEFLEKVYKSDRYSNLEVLQIEKIVEEDNDPSMLSASLEMDFSTLEKIKISDGNINDGVFSSDSLNTEIIDLIKNQKSVSNNIINIDQKGKANLFIP